MIHVSGADAGRAERLCPRVFGLELQASQGPAAIVVGQLENAQQAFHSHLTGGENRQKSSSWLFPGSEN